MRALPYGLPPCREDGRDDSTDPDAASSNPATAPDNHDKLQPPASDAATRFVRLDIRTGFGFFACFFMHHRMACVVLVVMVAVFVRSADYLKMVWILQAALGPGPAP